MRRSNPIGLPMARIALVGDSHTQILWPLLAAVLRTEGHEVVLSLARPGWEIPAYLGKDVWEGTRLGEAVHAARPDLVIVSLGGNNFELDPVKYTARIDRFLEAVGHPSRSVVWIGPATSDASKGENSASTGVRHVRTAALQRALLPIRGVRWIDSLPLTRTGHRSDGVHFENAAYRTWAAAVTPALLEAAKVATPAEDTGAAGVILEHRYGR